MTHIEKILQKKFNVDASYFLRGGFWTTVGQIAGIIGGIAATSLFAHYLSESEYGTYRYLIGIGVILSVFSLTGLGQAILQASAKKYSQFYSETLKINFLYSLGITVAGIIGTVYYLYNQNIVLGLGCLMIGAIQPFINAYKNTPFHLQGSRRFKEASMLQIIRTLVVTTLSIIALYATHNILILLFVYLLSQLCVNFFTNLYFHPTGDIPTPTNIRQKYLSYARHTSIRTVIGDIAYRLDTILVFQQLGAVELAIYSIANIIPEQIKGSFKNLAALLVPKYAQHENLESIKGSIMKRSLQLLFVFILVTILYILIAPLIYKFLFPKYESAILLSQLVALSFPATIALIPVSALQSQIEEKKLHTLNIQSSIILILTTLTFIIFFGLIGAIIAKILSRYANLFLSYRQLYKQNV